MVAAEIRESRIKYFQNLQKPTNLEASAIAYLMLAFYGRVGLAVGGLPTNRVSSAIIQGFSGFSTEADGSAGAPIPAWQFWKLQAETEAKNAAAMIAKTEAETSALMIAIESEKAKAEAEANMFLQEPTPGSSAPTALSHQPVRSLWLTVSGVPIIFHLRPIECVSCTECVPIDIISFVQMICWDLEVEEALLNYGYMRISAQEDFQMRKAQTTSSRLLRDGGGCMSFVMDVTEGHE
ncbi:hypothetical protein GOP47_0003050 [Adiantum capillus-veneris]|uniref:Uncharacterized protein n=1 Tax=Adiantum capillus-veneris TaxID=13818 RepID=A0A9D4VD87_ADICA|nr:hypothetical protein GOP47_0003050 [Adiantum capillus-veneris]